MELESLYFSTATIMKWQMLLKPDKYKKIIIKCLSFLAHKNKIHVYGFVIMPNHIHIIWELLALNNKEMPHASFFKYPSHVIQKDLKKHHPVILERFSANSESRDYQVWQGNTLSIELKSAEMTYQKFDYIHSNPCKGKWILSNSPIDYPFSSAGFYELGKDNFWVSNPYRDETLTIAAVCGDTSRGEHCNPCLCPHRHPFSNEEF